RLLLGFGLATWLHSFIFLVLMIAALVRFAGARWGWIGLGVVALVGLMTSGNLFREFCDAEVSKMIWLRRKRLAVWVLVLAGVVAGLFLIQIEDRAGGTFQVRAATRAELRAPVAGFLREIYCAEGARVSAGSPVARLEAADVASRLAQKRAEVR